jgi:hypothetical protein
MWSRTLKRALPSSDTWLFVGRNVGVGMLQALGAIALYALVIFVVIKHYKFGAPFQKAIEMRTGPLMAGFVEDVDMPADR